MKNVIIILTFFAFGAGLLYFFSVFEDKINTNIGTISASEDQSGSLGNNIEEESLTKEELVQKKIETIKSRLALKEMIIQGDAYFRDEQLALALKSYLDYYKKNPNDSLIIEKIGDTYFEMKKFGSSYNYYNQLQNLDNKKKQKFTLSYLFSKEVNTPSLINEFTNILKEKKYNEEEIFYLTKSLECQIDFHQCKIDFQEYFSRKNTDGTDVEITYIPLIDFKKAIENYQNFQVDEVYLKNAYIISSWYSNKLYPLAIKLGNELLQEKPGYKPVLKIVAQSSMELGDYEKARDSLGEYYKNDSNEAVIAYMLGIVNEKLKEYVLSNIYFNKALSLNYSPSTDVRRHIIHNFYLLENYENMLQAFEDFIKNEVTIEANDIGIAIYYAILYDDLEKAQLWSTQGQKLFPEKGDFYAYEGWILREKGRYADALSALKAGGEIEEKNPFIFINIAYTLQKMNNNPGALIYFKKVVEYAEQSDFGTQAQKEIDAIQATLKK